MATGDTASAAGYPVVPGTQDLRLGYIAINALADAIATKLAAEASARAAGVNAALGAVTAEQQRVDNWIIQNFAHEHALQPGDRGITAANTPASDRNGNGSSVQIQLNDVFNRLAAGGH